MNAENHELANVQQKLWSLQRSETIQDEELKNNNEDPYQENKVFSQIVKKQGNGITDQDLDDMFKVLKGQKEGIEILNKSVNESTR